MRAFVERHLELPDEQLRERCESAIRTTTRATWRSTTGDW
jgi:hypothetical protein